MKLVVRQSKKQRGFTIVELLTVMSIIVILIGLLVPALNQVKRYAWKVKQKTQLHSISAAIEMFNSEFDGYPDSGEKGPDGGFYCGAMKLCEAVMGQDLLGFHPDSTFRSDGTAYDPVTGAAKDLYPDANTVSASIYRDNLSTRKGPYLPLESANAYALGDLHRNTGPFDAGQFVLCDEYRRVQHIRTGKKVGMPVLYYKANTARSRHNAGNPDDPENIYNYRDNHSLVMLGMPWDPPSAGGQPHRLFENNGQRFYMNTKNEMVTTASRPYKADTFILISAGFDGEYGTPDDICNFDWKYRE
ncbi:MAG: type II secretion system protein [Phycisphaerales bacterium]|nr:MAG: type II secretion system protein [Phycisphaerales bacterium]